MNENITPLPDCSFCRDEGDVCFFCRADAYPALTARMKELEEALNALVEYAIPDGLRRGPAHDHWLEAMESALPFVTNEEMKMDIQHLVHVGRAALNKEPT